MRPEDELLCACTRQNFLEAHRQTALNICRREEVNWYIVYSTARLHGVAPLIFSNLQQCNPLTLGIPQHIVYQFKRYYYRSVVRKERKAERLTEALAFFDRKSIDVMLIKGAALEVLVYDQPWYTVPEDADLVLRLRREEISDKASREIMEFLHRSGIEYDYFEHHDVVMNGVLPIDFYEIWDDATKIRFRGRDVFVMSPEDMLMSTCINSCRKRFFRLKSLCDIAEIINKYPGLKWEELTRKARAYDCNNIVYTALLVTEMTLGCELPDEVLDNLAVSPVRETIIRSLIRYLSRRMSLSALYPFSGRNMFGRKVNLSLILPYATYRWYQVGRKMRGFTVRGNHVTESL